MINTDLNRRSFIIVWLIFASIIFNFYKVSSQSPASDYLGKDNISPDSSSFCVISDFIQQEVEIGVFVGAELLITKDNIPLYHRVYGMMDIEDSIPMQTNTIFNIRSMTKTFIGAGIHLLIEQGKLKYDTRVSDIISGFNNSKSRNITIWHLLSHTSGLPISFAESEKDYNCLLDLAIGIGERGPDFKPGDKFQYSDAGADVLGAVIELVSNKTLHEFLQENLFIPLKMADTYPISKTTDYRNNRVATSYGGSPDQWTKFWSYQEDPYYSFPRGSQSYYSSPADYSRFLSMLLDKGKSDSCTILSYQSVFNILTPGSIFKVAGTDMEYQTGFPDFRVYHGLMSMLFCRTDENGKNSVEVFGYGGSDGTFTWVLPEKGFVISVFTQSRNFSTSFQFYEFEKVLYQNLMNPKGGDEPKLVSPSLQQYLGKYTAIFQENEDYMFEILEIRNGLAVKIPGQPIFELNPPDNDGNWYFKASNMLSVSFKPDNNGSIRELVFSQRTNFIKNLGSDSNSDIGSSSLSTMVGEYIQPHMNLIIRIREVNKRIEIQIGEEAEILLKRNNDTGRWDFPGVANKHLEFFYNKNGDIVSLNIIDVLKLPKAINQIE